MKQGGFSLVAVIFLVTVLALAVVYLQRVSSVSVATNTLALQSTRAWQAAQAGAEWGVFQVVSNGACPAATSNFTLTEQSLSGFDVRVTCSSNNFTEQGNSVTIFELNVFAEYGTYGTTPDYVSRRLTLTVEN